MPGFYSSPVTKSRVYDVSALVTTYHPTSIALKSLTVGNSDHKSRLEEFCQNKGWCAITSAKQCLSFPQRISRLYSLRTKGMEKEELYAHERYRVLRARILDIMKLRNMKTLMVTSAVPGEGKTAASINLAVALNQVHGTRVLLVDCDMRKLGIADALGIAGTPGLEDALRGSASFEDVVQSFDNTLSFVPSGGVDESAAELLQSPRLKEFVEWTQREYDITVFDSPPLLPIADSRVLATQMDGVALCVLAGSTSETDVMEALELVRSKVIGSILMCADAREAAGYYYYYSHGETGTVKANAAAEVS